MKESKFCEPWCAGIESKPRQVGTKIAHLLDSLDRVNKNIIRGSLKEECYEFRDRILFTLRAEGWRIKPKSNRWQVLPPKE